jgi:UDP-N-acetylenolpyruvoylglucosamine reductase
MTRPEGAVAPVLSEADLGRLSTDIQRRVGIRVQRGVELARYTTMRVGGPADLFVEAHHAIELRSLVRLAAARELPLFLLGRGSDLVISDRGIRGLVVLVRAQTWRVEPEADPPLLIADAGLPMAKAATETQRAGLGGLEFGLAIPGTVGGAVWANGGAHGDDVAGVISSVAVLAPDGTQQILAATDLGLAYRDSRFKHAVGPLPEVILAATFRLRHSPPDELAARLDEIRRWRQAHQPLGLPSAGSVFRNPSPDVSAGSLIESAGLKGRRIGGAVVSEKHANFIVNDTAGSADDVRRLGDLVRAEVARIHGVELRYEIEFVGEWGSAGEKVGDSAGESFDGTAGASAEVRR